GVLVACVRAGALVCGDEHAQWSDEAVAVEPGWFTAGDGTQYLVLDPDSVRDGPDAAAWGLMPLDPPLAMREGPPRLAKAETKVSTRLLRGLAERELRVEPEHLLGAQRKQLRKRLADMGLPPPKSVRLRRERAPLPVLRVDPDEIKAHLRPGEFDEAAFPDWGRTALRFGEQVRPLLFAPGMRGVSLGFVSEDGDAIELREIDDAQLAAWRSQLAAAGLRYRAEGHWVLPHTRSREMSRFWALGLDELRAQGWQVEIDPDCAGAGPTLEAGVLELRSAPEGG